jgi:hypothetical protein
MADPQALEIGIGGHLRALLKARCFACVKLSRHGPFGLKAASTKFAVWPASRLALHPDDAARAPPNPAVGLFRVREVAAETGQRVRSRRYAWRSRRDLVNQ